VTGYTGQLSLGHAAFMSIGAYTAGILVVHYEVPFLAALLAGAIAAGFSGLLIGTPTLRLRGDYLAIATLGFGEIIRVVFLDMEITGGTMGLRGIPKQSQLLITLTVFIALAVTAFVLYRIMRSRIGRSFIAIREDEVAAEAMGINTTRYKIMAFTVSALFAGLAGGLYAGFYRYISPNSFGFLKSIEILSMVVLGGMGNFLGAGIGAAVLTVAPEMLRSFAVYRQVFYGALLVVMMLVRPAGLLGGVKLSAELFKKKTADRTAESGGETRAFTRD
jgi:branched-chain amino acid transport system permease protein